jgi:2-aminoethylphosphonate-pyruvate transaminase
MNVCTAVILAAGLGSRLKDRTARMPKGFLEIDGESLIERSVKQLLDLGIRQIIIGTGHASEHYEVFAARFPQVVCKRSDLYASTGSMYTFYNMRELLTGSLLLLESDLLYHPSGLQALLQHPSPDVILASGRTNSGDEVYIETGSHHRLFNMSKKPDDLHRIDAELVGISKLSSGTYRRMFAYCESVAGSLPKLDYEHAMVAVSDEQHPIAVHKIDQYPWCEIDDEQHLQRALQQVWPRIKNYS